MKSYFKLLEKVKNQAGVSAVIVAIVLPMLIGFTALAVDVGYMHVAKNELQNVADAAALAATRKLGTIYQGMTYSEMQAYVCGSGNNDIAVIKGVADAVAYNNKAGGKHIIVFDNTEGIDHVEIGVWDSSATPPFTATYNQPDAVRVTAHRDNAANGPITTFFAKIFGIDTVDVSADATAALTGQSSSEPGELVLPIGVSNLALEECNDPILFSPTSDSCAGWTSFTSGANNPNVEKIITGAILSPELTIGDTANFIGGELASGTFYELLLLFKDMGHDVYVDGVDADDNEILLPVATYDEDGTPVTGHLDAATLATLAADPNVTINGDVVPLWLTDADGNLILDADSNKIRLWYPQDGEPYKDDIPRNKHLWPTSVLVYYEGPDDGTTDCGNPNQSMIIDGFVTILFTDIIGPPYHVVKGQLLCDQYSNEDTRGGGGGGNTTKGTIPNLVE